MISVGIDVSKDKSTVCFLKPCGEVLVTPYVIFRTNEKIFPLVDFKFVELFSLKVINAIYMNNIMKDVYVFKNAGSTHSISYYLLNVLSFFGNVCHLRKV